MKEDYWKETKREKCKLVNSKKLAILLALCKWVMKWNKVTERKHSKFEKCQKTSSNKENKQYILQALGKWAMWIEIRRLEGNKVSL